MTERADPKPGRGRSRLIRAISRPVGRPTGGGGRPQADGSPPVGADHVVLRVPDQSAYGLSFYPPNPSLQDYLDSILTDGLVISKKFTGGLSPEPTALELMRSRAAFITTYTGALGHTEVGSNGVNTALLYGTPTDGASGYANVNNLYALVTNSAAYPGDPHGDPARNEVGGLIAVMRMGTEGQEVPPRATFWGSSYTLRGGWRGQEPGGLGAYTAVLQNHFDGPGSRIDHYAFAAVTWPGIGDGEDFWLEPGVGDRYAGTYAIPFGFIVAGQSGTWPDGGGIGYGVGVQSGGWATPWRGDRGHGYEDQRSKIGTGFRSIDWVENGLHIGLPHPDGALGAASILLDGSEAAPARPILARRTYSAEDLVLSEEPVILADGRVKAPRLIDDDDAVSTRTLPAAHVSAVGPVSAGVGRQVHATSTISAPPGTPTVVGPLVFSTPPVAGMYAIGSVAPDLGSGAAATTYASVEVSAPGEYEVTLEVEWDADPSGSFRSQAMMTLEDGPDRPKVITSNHIPTGLLSMGLRKHDAYQSTFRVRSDQSGKPVFAVVAHDAPKSLRAVVSLLIRPVMVDTD